jgi:hypothetical protein
MGWDEEMNHSTKHHIAKGIDPERCQENKYLKDQEISDILLVPGSSNSRAISS